MAAAPAAPQDRLPRPPDAGGAAPARDRRFRWSLAAVAAVGLAWRVGYVLVEKRPVDTCGQPRCGDAVYYVAQSLRLAEGHLFDDPANHGMPAADHPPVTALLLTPSALLRDAHITPGRLTMALVGTATIVVVGLLARRLAGGAGRGDAAGLVAAALAAANPNLWMNDALAMAEAPAALVVATVLLLTYRLLDAPGLRRAAWLGLACGLAVLTRSELALLVPLTVAPAVLLARAGPDLRRRLALVGVVAVVGVATTLPWVAFNLARFDRPTLLSTNDGLTLVGANCDPVYEGGGLGFWNLECARAVDPTVPDGADQSVRSEIYRDEGLAYLGDHTDRLPAVVAARVGRVWNLHHPEQMVWLNQGEGRERWASWAGVWAFWLLLGPAVAGIAVLWRRRVPVWPLVSTAVLATLVAAAFYGIVRFRVPFDVAQTAAAGVALGAAWQRWGPSRPPVGGAGADGPARGSVPAGAVGG